MIIYALSPRTAVIEAAERAGVGIVPVGAAEGLGALPPTSRRIEVADPLDALQVARALVRAGVEPGDRQCVCVGLGDDSSQAAALVNTALGLAAGRHASFAALEAMRDKYRLRERLGAGSSLNGRYWLADSCATVADIMKTSPKGVVVKPLDGSGSRGVVRISSPAQCIELPVSGETLLVEEYFSGPEYSVETMTWNGVHHPLVVTAKTIGGGSGLVETGQRQPARLSQDHTQRLFAAAAEVLSAVDYTYGLSHIEFILQDGSPKLVEAHGRVGGDRIADLMQWSIGISGFEALFRAYRDDFVTPADPTGMEAAIEFVDLRTWTRSDEDWTDIVTGLEGVVETAILRGRDERSEILSSSDRHAHVVIIGSSIDRTIDQIKNMGRSQCAS
jgi:hypothetical protein